MALLVGVAGCGASDPTDSGVDAAAPSDSGPFDSGLDPDADLALVGTWSGSVAGSLGSTEIIAELLDDGSFTTPDLLRLVRDLAGSRGRRPLRGAGGRLRADRGQPPFGVLVGPLGGGAVSGVAGGFGRPTR